MAEFKIISPYEENIELTDKIPEAFSKYGLAGAETVMAKSEFGNMLFHHFAGNGFDIWYSNYLMKKSVLLKGSVNEAILELHIPFVNDFIAAWDGLDNNNLRNHQFELSFVPFVNTRAEFKGGVDYHTFDIHFRKEILMPYAQHCRKLADFLERVEQGKPANMLDMIQFISLDMIRIIRSMISYTSNAQLAANYFNSLVHELLTLMTIQVAEITDTIKFPQADLEKAREVQKIILSDFEEYDTVEQLARKVATTESKLQLAFKHIYGTTVAKFSREARMVEAFRLLQETDHTLNWICLKVGFPDPGNFSVAFRKHFGYWPGYIQKNKKR